MIWNNHHLLCVFLLYCIVPCQGPNFSKISIFLDLGNYYVGAVYLRDFVNHSKDSPVPQSYHTQDYVHS